MSIARSYETFAAKKGINLVYLPESDGCELTINYVPAVNFADYRDKRNDMLDLLQIAKNQGVYLKVLAPTFKDMDIDPALFNDDKYIERILRAHPNQSTRFNESVRDYVSIMTMDLCNRHLKTVEGGKFKHYRVTCRENNLCLDSYQVRFEDLANKPTELKEIVEAIKGSVISIEQFFSSSNIELTEDIAQIKKRTDEVNKVHKHKHHKQRISSQGFFGSACQETISKKDASNAEVNESEVVSVLSVATS